MNDPVLVRIEPDKMTVDSVRQVIYYPSNDEKPRLLVGLLKHMDPRRSMVFVNTRRAAEDIELLLRGNGINAEAISGDVPQRKRLRMLRDFHEGTLAVLIGTDVASRGLHIPDVSHVFNYDLPQDPEDYVHRIGRTARAGAEGDAISFGCEEYVISLPDIEAYIGRKLPVATVSMDMLPEINAPDFRPRHRPRFSDQRNGGRRGGGGGGGSRGHGGGRDRRGGSQQSFRPPRPESPPAKVAPAGASTEPVAANGDEPLRKRRRRRRGKRSGNTAAPPPEPTT
jgi:ATP-dependent RNA helicase RhlB